MRVAVVNAGSSSLKLAVVEDERVVDGTTVEHWDGRDLDPLRDLLGRTGELDAVGHRVVHGGPRHAAAARVDDDLLAYLDSIDDLAPLHNPPAVAAIRRVRELLPDVPGVACFDTSFHADLPVDARTYALPREWNQRWSLRRYGFHGLSHAYAVRRGAELIGLGLRDLRVVSCHLGSGCSLAAVRDGRSVDTTMGFTPLEGLVMGTRSGSVDPGLLLWLLQHGDTGVEELSDALEHRSGLKGLSGTSGDLREVLELREDDEDARLAYSVFVHRLRRDIGAMVAATGGLDLLVFTGGMGQHAPRLRADVAQELGWLGVAVDPDLNQAVTADSDVSTPDAPARTVVVAASEETEVARQTTGVLRGLQPSARTGAIRAP